MNTEKVIKRDQKYIMHTYARSPLVLEHGEGMYAYDADGKAYRAFTGDKLTVTEGEYLFLIDEINDGQTNITYDESKYWLNLGFVENAEGEVSLAGQRVRKFVDGDTYETVLALEDSEWMIVDTSISPVYFENTIDTGKDDYYPIIIPTIINKDTGIDRKSVV